MRDPVTTNEDGQIYGGVADWRIRRAVDALGVQIPRAGRYRLIPRALLGPLAIELGRRGWLPEVSEEATDSAEGQPE